LRYGTIPVVRRTGGLADTVIDTNDLTLHNHSANGFVFDDASAACMIQTLSRALVHFHAPSQWRLLQQQAMTAVYGWDKSAAAYMALYETVTGVTPEEGSKNTGGEKEQAAQRAVG
jgi:starch synthase